MTEQHETTTATQEEPLSEQALIQELTEKYGLEPSDFEPEEWSNLVEYILTIQAEGGNVEEILLGLDIQIETAAGPLIQPNQNGDPLQLGTDSIRLDELRDLTPANSTEGRGGRGNGNTPGQRQSGDDPLVDPINGETPPPPPIEELFGTPGNDLLIGDENGVSRDIITAYAGNDTIFGAQGADTMHMGSELRVNDSIDGGDGVDELTYTDNNRNATNELDNVTNVERIVLGSATTKVTTVDGLVAAGASLEVDGSGLGNKALIFDGRAETDGSFDITSDNGKDTIRGGAKNDTIHAGGNKDKLYGYAGNDSLFGGGGNDSVYGHEGNDFLSGEAGSDRLYGDVGNDTLDGGSGNDRLYGGEGNDSLIGGDGNDRLEANEGNDTLQGGVGNDQLYGHEGSDQLVGGIGKDKLYGGDDNDLLYGGEGNDSLYGNDGDDSMTGDAGNDRLYGHDGDDTVDGGAGNDQIYGHDGDDRLTAGDGNDKVYGGDGNDTLFGGAGRDTMQGNAGNDYLEGGADNDNLRGHAGNDLLYGGTGADTLRGDAGNDTFRYDDLNEGGDRINGFVSGQDGFQFDASEFDSTAGFHSSRISGYDGSNASLGTNDATFVYDTRNGNLWYDENGDEAGGQTLIADVNGQHVDAGDIDIV